MRLAKQKRIPPEFGEVHGLRLTRSNREENPMLVLSRKLNERIQIGENITIVVAQVKGNVVRIGIEAPKNVRVLRSEISSETALKQDASHERKRFFSCMG